MGGWSFNNALVFPERRAKSEVTRSTAAWQHAASTCFWFSISPGPCAVLLVVRFAAAPGERVGAVSCSRQRSNANASRTAVSVGPDCARKVRAVGRLLCCCGGTERTFRGARQSTVPPHVCLSQWRPFVRLVPLFGRTGWWIPGLRTARFPGASTQLTMATPWRGRGDFAQGTSWTGCSATRTWCVWATYGCCTPPQRLMMWLTEGSCWIRKKLCADITKRRYS